MINFIRFFFQYLKDRRDIYSDKVKTDFQPLEYIEVKEKKPLIIKLSEEWAFKCNLGNFFDFIKFNQIKNRSIDAIDKLNDADTDTPVKQLQLIHYRVLVELLYEISKNHFISKHAKRTNSVREKYKKFLDDYLFDMENFNFVFKKVLEYNSGLKKKLLALRNFQIFSANTSPTIGGVPLSDLIKIDPKTGEKYFADSRS